VRAYFQRSLRAAAALRNARRPAAIRANRGAWSDLQDIVGNRAVAALVGALGPGARSPLSVPDPQSGAEREADAHAADPGEAAPEPVAAAPAAARAVHPAVAGVIHAARGAGTALPEALREPAEDRTGADLAGVRLHTDRRAAAAAEALGAQAFTRGADIYFGASQYQPGTRAGRALVAHEVAHAAQNVAGGATAGGVIARKEEPGQQDYLQGALLRDYIDRKVTPGPKGHVAAASVGLGKYFSPPGVTIVSAEAQLDALVASHSLLPAVSLAATIDKPATLVFATSDRLGPDARAWLQMLADQQGWTVEVLVPSLDGVQGMDALVAGMAGRSKHITLVREARFAPTAGSTSTKAPPSAADPAAPPGSSGPPAGAVVPTSPRDWKHAKTNRPFPLRVSTAADADVIDHVMKGLWVDIVAPIEVDGKVEAFEIYVRSTGRPGVASRWWLDPKSADEAKNADKEDEDLVEDILRGIEAERQPDDVEPVFAVTTQEFPLRVSTAADADVIDHLVPGIWVEVLEAEGEAYHIYVPSTGRPGVAHRSWIEIRTIEEAKAADEDIRKMLEPDPEPEAEEEPAAAAEEPADEPEADPKDLLRGVDADKVAEAEIDLYRLDLGMSQRYAALPPKPHAPPPLPTPTESPAEQKNRQEVEEWAAKENVETIVTTFFHAFEDATLQIGRNLIGNLEQELEQTKGNLSSIAASVHQSNELTRARNGVAERHRFNVWAANKARQMGLNQPPIASNPKAVKFAQEAEAKDEEIAGKIEDLVRGVAAHYPYAARAHDRSDKFPWEKLAATTTGEEVATILAADVESRLDSCKRARESLTDRRSIYKFDGLLAHAYEIFQIEPGSTTELALQKRRQAATPPTPLAIIVMEIALAFVPLGGWARAAVMVGSLLQTAEAIDEFGDMKAAHEVGLLSQEPAAGWLLLQIAASGLDAGAFLKLVGPKLWQRTVKALSGSDPAAVRSLKGAYAEIEKLGKQRAVIDDLLENDAAYKDAVEAFKNAPNKPRLAMGYAYGPELEELAKQAAKSRWRVFQRWFNDLKKRKIIQKLTDDQAKALREVFDNAVAAERKAIGARRAAKELEVKRADLRKRAQEIEEFARDEAPKVFKKPEPGEVKPKDAVWKFRQQLAMKSEDVADDILDLVPDLKRGPEHALGGSKIDRSIRAGGKKAELELKYAIPRKPKAAKVAELAAAKKKSAFERFIAQCRAMVDAKPDEAVVWSLKKPTSAELSAIKKELGEEVYDKIKFLDGPDALYDWAVAFGK
jgi:hypothetical protein